MARDDLKWIDIRDFRPGIRDVGDLPLGSCTRDSHGCIAAETGELIPLEKATAYTPTNPSGFVNVQNNEVWVSGFHVTGPLTGAAVASGNQNEYHIAWEWIATTGAPNPHREYRWERHQMFANPVVIDTIKSISSGIAASASGLHGTFFEDVRMDAAVATNPGRPLVAAAWYESGGSSFVSVYPDPSAPTTNNELDISTALPCDIIVAHQGRLVLFEQRGWSHGSPGSWISNEQIWYTNINLPTLEPSVAATFATDRMTGIGVAKSVSASEFLIVKFDEGAYAVSGDFSNPTVIRLPGVAPTYGGTTIPVYTSLGLVYGQLAGSVWAWGGGDTAQDLAPFLEESFWAEQATRYINYDGSFAYWKDRIVTPRSWVMDTKSGGWWRLRDIDDSRQYRHNQTDWAGTLYCAYSMVNDAGDSVVDSYGFQKRESYYWLSNRIPLGAQGRQFEVREIIVEYSGGGNGNILTIELGGDTKAGPLPASITLPVSTSRTTIRRAVKINVGGYMTVALTANSNVANTQAVTVHSVKLGYHESTAINAT